MNTLFDNDLKYLYGQTFKELRADPVFYRILKIKQYANGISIYCRACSSYYHCATKSNYKLCCLYHGFKLQESDANNITIVSIFINVLEAHKKSAKHKKAYNKYMRYDTQNREQTYYQCLSVESMIRKSCDDTLFEELQYNKSEEVNNATNKNQSSKRVKVVADVFYDVIV